jgi:hypothetical protein
MLLAISWTITSIWLMKPVLPRQWARSNSPSLSYIDLLIGNLIPILHNTYYQTWIFGYRFRIINHPMYLLCDIYRSNFLAMICYSRSNSHGHGGVSPIRLICDPGHDRYFRDHPCCAAALRHLLASRARSILRFVRPVIFHEHSPLGRYRLQPHQSSPVSSGTILNRSPTRPMSATWKIGASSSLLMAMMVLLSFMPARCWIAPDMPIAT